MKILAFAGSSSKSSINKRLAIYAAGLFEQGEVQILDLNEFELPLFSVDKEKEIGQPAIAKAFLDKIAAVDVLVLSLAEHNGSFSVAFKNIFDWASRQEKKVFAEKPMLLMATSPGKRGGATVLEVAQLSLPSYGGNIREVFSLPSFNNNFDVEKNSIIDPVLDAALREAVARMQA
jgi:chromate reductase, NAD(P)H dehydrogenase (quinone)